MTYKKEVEDKLALSLTATDNTIIPFLPYLLQDLWELGANSKDIINLLKSADFKPANKGILDLACGKGAVSVNLAKTFNCQIKGIDIIQDFISYAKIKANEHNVGILCSFVVEDINLSIKKERVYDCVILGAAGNVLGSPYQTLSQLKEVIIKGGYLVLDDAYVDQKDDLIRFDNDYMLYEEWLDLFRKLNLTLINKQSGATEAQYQINLKNTKLIEKRANELKKLHKEKLYLFDEYIKNQYEETEDLNDSIKGITWLLQKN